MREIFTSLWKMAGGANGEKVYSELEKHYSDKNRHYHNLEHIKNALCYSNMGKNILALELAIFFHDAIYDPERSDNEEKSADYFKEVAKKNGLKKELIKEVNSLILATKHQKKPEEFDEKLICDIDLAGLGQDYDIFSRNNELIRPEYAIYSDEEYRVGRREFMSKMLERREIFYTEEFKKYEQQARENIERFLAE